MRRRVEWDTNTDRLFGVEHCEDGQGVGQTLRSRILFCGLFGVDYCFVDSSESNYCVFLSFVPVFTVYLDVLAVAPRDRRVRVRPHPGAAYHV